MKKIQLLKKENQKGITLIALVVTIVVLLILAGVSISMLTGENGIVKQAIKAKDDNTIADEKEAISLAYTACKQENLYQKNVTDTQMQKEMDNNNRDVTVTKHGKDLVIVYNKTNNTYVVNQKGEIEKEDNLILEDVYNGEATEIPEFKQNETTGGWDWYIYTCAQLKFLSNFTNKTLTTDDENLMAEKNVTRADIEITESTNIYLMNNLNLGATFNTEDGTLVSGTEWVPIGHATANRLLGTFEGNEYYISGIYINNDNNFNGLFGNSSTIKNLTIKDSYISGAACVGGIVGAIRSGILENCHNVDATVVLANQNLYSTGGIVGQSQAEKIENCSNRGTIIVNGVNPNYGSQAGGICGMLMNGKIINCVNYGDINSVVGNVIGGIVGNTTSEDILIINCVNNGKIQGYQKIGGICGILGINSTISQCANYESVTATDARAGGIVAHMNQASGYSYCVVEECYNSGNIYSGGSAGGIVAFFGGELEIGSVTRCYTKGKIEADGNKGAVVGLLSGTKEKATLNHLYYLRSVGIGAIQEVDYEDENIKAIDDDFQSLEEFLIWIRSK